MDTIIYTVTTQNLSLGSCRLCRHNLENNRCAWEFENIPGIIGNFLRIMSDTLTKFLDECYVFLWLVDFNVC